MVVIRLARGGAKKRPFFNIVATDSRNRRDGRFIERIGFYNPVASGGEESFRIVQDRLTYWQGVGAQLSPTVARLVSSAGKKAAADTDQELVEAAVQHAVAVHRHEDTPEFREQLKQICKEGTPPVERPMSMA